MKSLLVIGSGNAFCSDGRAQACFLLENSSGETLLLDCGATSLMQMNRLGVDVASLDRLLVTHFHGDHIGGIPFLLLHFQYIVERARPFQILGPVGIREAVDRIFEAMYSGVKLTFDLQFTELVADDVNTTAGFTIDSVPVSHKPESLGYRIRGPSGRTFAFSGDTRWCDNLEQLYDGIDTGLLELSLLTQPEGGTSHLSLEEVLEHRTLLRARRLYFSHIYDDLAEAVRQHNAVFPGFGEPVADGMRIDL